MDHFSFLRLKIVFNLLSFALLLLAHVFVIALGTEIISDSHAQPVSDHGGYSEG
jgi:hypothetical protein